MSHSLVDARTIFITGTDTGVGKTVLTGLLLCHLREAGLAARAIKPVSSGGRADARLLHELQRGQFTMDELNPFHFRKPLTPMLAARDEGRILRLEAVLEHIRKSSGGCEVLLVEGAGGLLSPLGEAFNSGKKRNRGQKLGFRPQFRNTFSAADLIKRLGCESIVVARNALGTINHTCLAVNALQVLGIEQFNVCLMDQMHRDTSTGSNPTFLRELLAGTPVISVPWLRGKLEDPEVVKKISQKTKITLAPLFD